MLDGPIGFHEEYFVLQSRIVKRISKCEGLRLTGMGFWASVAAKGTCRMNTSFLLPVAGIAIFILGIFAMCVGIFAFVSYRIYSQHRLWRSHRMQRGAFFAPLNPANPADPNYLRDFNSEEQHPSLHGQPQHNHSPSAGVTVDAHSHHHHHHHQQHHSADFSQPQHVHHHQDMSPPPAHTPSPSFDGGGGGHHGGHH
jgi:hypothetical protein